MQERELVSESTSDYDFCCGTVFRVCFRATSGVLLRRQLDFWRRWLNVAIQTLVLNQVSKFASLKMSRSRQIYSHYWARENMMSATCAKLYNPLLYNTQIYKYNEKFTLAKCASRGEIFRNCQRREKHKTWMRSTHMETPGANTKCGEISL